MRCFMQQEVHDPRFPKLSSRVSYLKEEEGGVSVMCEIMERYMNEAEEKATKRERINTICKMIRKGFDRDTIIGLDYTEDEYAEAEKSMIASA